MINRDLRVLMSGESWLSKQWEMVIGHTERNYSPAFLALLARPHAGAVLARMPWACCCDRWISGRLSGRPVTSLDIVGLRGMIFLLSVRKCR
jgi:hypothetical protein